MEQPLGPLASQVAGIVNATRIRTDAEMQLLVHGEIVELSDEQAIHYVLMLASAALESLMVVARNVDDLTTRIDAIENGQRPAI